MTALCCAAYNAPSVIAMSVAKKQSHVFQQLNHPFNPGPVFPYSHFGQPAPGPGRKKPPPIIERTCAFDAKIYKNVDGIFAVNPCLVCNKNFSKLFYFYFQLPSLLVEKPRNSYPA